MVTKASLAGSAGGGLCAEYSLAPGPPVPELSLGLRGLLSASRRQTPGVRPTWDLVSVPGEAERKRGNGLIMQIIDHAPKFQFCLGMQMSSAATSQTVIWQGKPRLRSKVVTPSQCLVTFGMSGGEQCTSVFPKGDKSGSKGCFNWNYVCLKKSNFSQDLCHSLRVAQIRNVSIRQIRADKKGRFSFSLGK